IRKYTVLDNEDVIFLVDIGNSTPGIISAKLNSKRIFTRVAFSSLVPINLGKGSVVKGKTLEISATMDKANIASTIKTAILTSTLNSETESNFFQDVRDYKFAGSYSRVKFKNIKIKLV
ncbi:MAG: hypothetical protein AAFO95_22160, partial [Cyanobacteria bacterium J06600_6]